MAGEGLFSSVTLRTGKFGFAALTKRLVVKAGAGFVAGGVAETGRQYAATNSLENPDWGKIAGAGLGGAALDSFVKFGGNAGLPVLDFLKPEYVGISSSIFAMLPSRVYVLDYADDLWGFRKAAKQRLLR